MNSTSSKDYRMLAIDCAKRAVNGGNCEIYLTSQEWSAWYYIISESIANTHHKMKAKTSRHELHFPRMDDRHYRTTYVFVLDRHKQLDGSVTVIETLE